MLTIKTLTNKVAPLTTTSSAFDVRRETDTETIYQLPDSSKASKDLETITVRKKTLARNLNNFHSQQIISNVPWFEDVGGVPTLGGYENVTINITSSAKAPASVRTATAQRIASIFEVNLTTGVAVSDDVEDFINARRL